MKASLVAGEPGEHTCIAGPWCETPVEQNQGTRLCSAHYSQSYRGQGLKPLEGTLEEALQRAIPLPDLSEGVCAGSGLDFTEITEVEEAQLAVELCAGCPVLDACRAFAEATHERKGRGKSDPWPVEGVWGGALFLPNARKDRGEPRVIDLLEDEREEMAA